MRLVTYAPTDQPNVKMVGVLEGDHVYHADSAADSVLGYITRGMLPSAVGEALSLENVILKAPLLPPKLIGVGRNYADHAAELGGSVPEEPLLFAVFNTSVIGPGQTITWQKSLTSQVDWEGELAVIIGRMARRVSVEDAMDYVFGYTIANDVSARDLQGRDGQWLRAKSMDTFCPLGPWLVTKDEVPDPHALTLTTRVNGETMQQASTSQMVYRVPQLVAHCSQALTLQPGDVILTGTPAGVGKGMNPPRFLKTGDIVSITIDGIGTLENPCEARP